MTDSDATTAAVAASLPVPLAALDVFVLRRVTGGRFVHLGGYGRAEAWAGIVEVDLDHEPVAAQAWSLQQPVRQSADAAVRVIGPYWSRSAVFVPLPPDHLVVVGSVQSLHVPEAAAVALARRLRDEVCAVSPAKRLADELELLHAVQRVTSITATDVHATATHVATVAAQALSCELGVVWLPYPDVIAVSNATPAAVGTPTPPRLRAVMAALHRRRASLPECRQDNRLHPLPAPLGRDSTVVAWYALAIRDPVDGMLLLCHTRAKPRGFTQLCQQIGSRIADAAATPLANALAHHELHGKLARAAVAARRDPLTAVANRLAWEETVRELTRDRRHRTASIVMIDVDCLKQINDEAGHRTGDDVLKAVADALQQSIRDGDVVARIGGDEFAVLLPDTTEPACLGIVARIEETIEQLPAIADHRVAASVGWASFTSAESVDTAMRNADRRMYANKHARATRHGRRPLP